MTRAPQTPALCAVCAQPTLVPHLRVAGAAGPEGLVPTTLRFGTALSDIARCASCGHMQLDPLPSQDTLAAAYAQAQSDDYLAEEAGQRATARTALSRLLAHLPVTARPPRLLDVGCWLGFLLDEARGLGWRPVGLEPSRYASRHARERLGLDVIEADLEHAELPESAFDAIVMADVIEHLLDPGATLEALRRCSRPDGLLYLVLPDAGSRVARLLGARWWSVIPTHVHYFTRSSIALLLVRHGWEPLEVATAPKAFTVRYYLSRLEGYVPALSRALVALADRAPLGSRLVTLDFRDRMVVIARRAGARRSTSGGD